MVKWPKPITGGASDAGNLNPKTVPNSYPPKYQKNTTKIIQTNRLLKNSFGFGKKHSSIVSPLIFEFFKIKKHKYQ